MASKKIIIIIFPKTIYRIHRPKKYKRSWSITITQTHITWARITGHVQKKSKPMNKIIQKYKINTYYTCVKYNKENTYVIIKNKNNNNKYYYNKSHSNHTLYNNYTNTTPPKNCKQNKTTPLHLLLLLCGDIETNPGPMPYILKTHPPPHKNRCKMYFIACTIKLHPEYQHLEKQFSPIINLTHPNH